MERDFKKRRVSRLTLQRLVDGKYQSVWFQCEKYGWDSHAGGEFYVISPFPSRRIPKLAPAA
jgi:hypothetical protein